MDILEGNSQATAYTLHPCSTSGQYRCSGTECSASDAQSSICDKDGCGFNPYQVGDQAFLGTGKKIDTKKKFTVVTQFITSDGTSNGDLTEIRRLWVQDGVVYQNPESSFTGLTGDSLTDKFCDGASTLFGGNNVFKARGGMGAIGDAMADGMVLTFSIWTDATTHMLWLDGDFPIGYDPSKPGISRGPCPADSGNPADVLREQSDATVTFSDIRIGDIGSTYSGGTTTQDNSSGTTSRNATTQITVIPLLLLLLLLPPCPAPTGPSTVDVGAFLLSLSSGGLSTDSLSPQGNNTTVTDPDQPIVSPAQSTTVTDPAQPIVSPTQSTNVTDPASPTQSTKPTGRHRHCTRRD